MGLRTRRNQDDELIEGEPSMLGRGRRRREGAEASDVQEGIPSDRESEEHLAADENAASPQPISSPPAAGAPEGVRDQLERLAGQIRGLQQQVEDFVTRRNDAVAEQASQRVASVIQAAEESAVEIAADAHREAAELLECARAEARAEANRVRVEAQAEASKIRTEAHADAALLREQVLAEVERIGAQLAEDLRSSAREALDRVAGKPPAEVPPEAPSEPQAPGAEAEEPVDPDVEEAVDELQSAAAVLEQSLRHLHEIGQELPEAE